VFISGEILLFGSRAMTATGVSESPVLAFWGGITCDNGNLQLATFFSSAICPP
jgi:hypothetical protein